MNSTRFVRKFSDKTFCPVLFSCLLLFTPWSLKGQDQQISFRKLTVEDGLSQNSVISIAQDKLGILWFATQDGLNRYDGLNFEKFDEYFDDITKPNVTRLGKVFIDRDDQIWLITKVGKLKRYNPYTLQVLEVDAVKNVSCIFQDHNGKIIVGTWSNGIYIKLINPMERYVNKELCISWLYLKTAMTIYRMRGLTKHERRKRRLDKIYERTDHCFSFSSLLFISARTGTSAQLR